MALRRALLLAALGVAGCGGQMQGGGDGGLDGAAQDVSTTNDGSIGPCNAGDARLCGGQCGQPCGYCVPSHNNPNYKGELGICSEGSAHLAGYCYQCEDPYVCVLEEETRLRPSPIDTFGVLRCADERWALMYSLNGRNDLARYTDRSTYTGTPLGPPPTSCPSIPGLQLCGGACGACATDYVCMGRSPLHPYSLCLNKLPIGACDRSSAVACSSPPGEGCLTFKVDSASQPVADAYGLCVDRTICDAAALSYPGGAFCTGGQ